MRPANFFIKSIVTSMMVFMTLGATAQCGWFSGYPYQNSNPTVSHQHNVMHEGDKYFYVDASSKRIGNIFGGTWMYGVLDNSSQPVRTNTRFLKNPNSSDLYYIGTDSRIYKTYWAGTSWVTSALNTSAPLVRSNTQIALSNANNKIYFIGNDDKLYDMATSNGAYTYLQLNWHDYWNGDRLYFESSTDLVVDSQDRIWFVSDGAGTNGGISYVYWSNAPGYFLGWTQVRWPNRAANGTFAPTVRYSTPIVVSQNNDVFYQRNDGRIVHFNAGNPGDYHRPWTIEGSYSAQNSTLSMAWDDSKLVFVSSNNRVRNLYFSGGVWQDHLVNSQYISNPSPVWIHDGEILFTDIANGGMRLMKFDWISTGCKTDQNISDDLFASDDDKIKFYPNPTSDVITFDNFTDKPTEIRLISGTGQLIEQIEIAPNSTSVLDVSSHAKGVYLLQWNSEEQTRTERLIIQ